ncbi:UDP-glycosyltransferase 73E1-like [Hordeum vulgare subsp. vulgare]|uniref:Glycosyltransferase n=1 Tax=Hordeum vulgare subsp. vulgare TaxID=112509 RepID=A0A8I6YS69_HORVV|nr:UDP-glycosyltransferase 73E1-like [Hordeum vulgare subsp. vulgare]
MSASTMAPTQQALAAAAMSEPPHFVLVPLAAHGHLIPMVDLARLLASRGARVSLLTTSLNARRLRDGGVTDKAARAKLLLEVVELPYSPADYGLPPDCQNADMIANNAQMLPFFLALRDLAGPFEAYVRALVPLPSCIISDWCNSWTAGVAACLGIPRLFFQGPSCFFSLCDLNAAAHGLHEDREPHVVPGMSMCVKVGNRRAHGFFTSPGCNELRQDAVAAMRTSHGAVINTFLDLEEKSVACYEAALGKPVWALGPLCLHNRDGDDMASRGGDKGGVSERAIVAWLDKQAPDSVVYVSFGSVARKLPKQQFEIGHGLEHCGRPFLWVVKESELASPESRMWLENLEARTSGRGLVVRGWAPQLAVLSHRSVGGFVTHCGWNSVLESIAHGVPVLTWPHFADQFLNEQLAVDVLGVGLRIGVTMPIMILNDDAAAPVLRGDIARAVSELMQGGEEAEERRRKAKEYGAKARRAMEKGGDSYERLTQLIESFRHAGGKEHCSGVTA